MRESHGRILMTVLHAVMVWLRGNWKHYWKTFLVKLQQNKYVSNGKTRYMGEDLCKKVNDVGRRRSEMKLRANGRT